MLDSVHNAVSRAHRGWIPLSVSYGFKWDILTTVLLWRPKPVLREIHTFWGQTRVSFALVTSQAGFPGHLLVCWMVAPLRQALKTIIFGTLENGVTWRLAVAVVRMHSTHTRPTRFQMERQLVSMPGRIWISDKFERSCADIVFFYFVFFSSFSFVTDAYPRWSGLWRFSFSCQDDRILR